MIAFPLVNLFVEVPLQMLHLMIRIKMREKKKKESKTWVPDDSYDSYRFLEPF